MKFATLVFLSAACCSPGCNPLVDSACMVQNPALSAELFGFNVHDFDVSGNVIVDADADRDADVGAKGADGVITQLHTGYEQETQLVMHRRFDNPLVASKFSILYGKVECELLAATGSGIISSLYLQSNDLDEIDIAELFGNNPFEVQSNFFIKGNTSNWDRGGYHQVPNPLQNYNKYTVEWTPEAMKWYVNDQHVKLSLWAGGDPSNSPGTIMWAGGVSDYAQFPYIMKFRRLYVNDYSSGLTYRYGNDGHKWVTLHSENGQIGGRVGGFSDEMEENKTDSKEVEEVEEVEKEVEKEDSKEDSKEMESESTKAMYQLSILLALEVAFIVVWF